MEDKMAAGFKLENLNTAAPRYILDCIRQYLDERDIKTIRQFGVPQSLINKIQSEDVTMPSLAKAIEDGSLDPSRDLDIPGDLYKWTLIPPGDSRKSPFVPERILSGAVPSPIGGTSISKKSTKGGVNSNFVSSYYNPTLTSVSTAPSINRLLSLPNAYGGMRSILMCHMIGYSVGAFEGFKYDPEQKEYPLPIIPLFGGRGRFFQTFIDRFTLSGEWSGYNYKEKKNHSFAVDEKFQVPRYIKKNEKESSRYNIYHNNYVNYLAAGGGYILSEKHSNSPYRNPNMFTPEVAQGPTTSIVVDTINGKETFEGNPNVIPWLEWPEIWDGNVYRPLKSPLGVYAIEKDLSIWKKFREDGFNHYTAIRDWIDTGCPCDWEKWGSYKDPVTLDAEKKQQEKEVLEATTYVPTATTTPTPPAFPKVGDVWQDSRTGKAKVFVAIDALRGTWVDG